MFAGCTRLDAFAVSMLYEQAQMLRTFDSNEIFGMTMPSLRPEANCELAHDMHRLRR